MNDLVLPVSEQFRSIQGEGKTTGVPAYFLRLKSCNMLCGGKGTDKDKLLHDGATWRCDSIEVWLKGVNKSFEQIVEDFGPMFKTNLFNRSHHLVITGGEPLLHQEKLIEFIKYLNPLNSFIEVETNGSIMPQPWHFTRNINQWNVSPKLSNSGVPESKRINKQAIDFFNFDHNSQFKFVVSSRADFMEVIKTYLMPFNILPRKVCLMPAADNDEQLKEVSQIVAEICSEEGFNFSSRLQVAVWNKKTGV